MKVKDAYLALKALVEYPRGDYGDCELVIENPDKIGIGPTPVTAIDSIELGFDWNAGQVIISPVDSAPRREAAQRKFRDQSK